MDASIVVPSAWHTNPYVLLPPLAYYSLGKVLVGGRLDSARAWFETTGAARWHNAAMAVYSLLVCLHVCSHWASSGPPGVCNAPHPGFPTWVLTTWYWSKMWEWWDTLILMVRGRTVTRLHGLHHAITASLVALQHGHWQQPHTPLYEWGTALNAGVHTLMYVYYFAPSTFSGVRTFVTFAQTVQHAIMMILILSSLSYVVNGQTCVVDESSNLVPALAYLFFLVEFSMLLFASGNPTNSKSK